MKKTVFLVFSLTALLTAVEWNTVQITQENYDAFSPVLALDHAGKARILFIQWGEESAFLKTASNATGSWSIKNVAQVNEAEVYSIDVDEHGNSHVAYFDYLIEDNYDIFYATDKEGSFASVNLTDDGLLQVAPVLKIDREGAPHIIYVQADEVNAQLYHGWLEDGELKGAEKITTNLYQDDYIGYDMVFDPLHGVHVFYIGDDTYLWKATSGEPAWLKEKINSLSSEWPSAVADPMGSLHVAYDADRASIHYTTNASGTWQDEIVTDNAPEGGGDWRPNLVLDNLFGYHAVGKPHIAWIRYGSDYWGDLWYSTKPDANWAEEAITSEPGKDEWPGFGRYFAIDAEGYGHIVYDYPDSEEIWQIMYAKSKEPIAEPVAIAEDPPRNLSPSLSICGAQIRFSIPQSSFIRLTLYDASGRMVKELASGTYPAGQNEIGVNSSALPAGVYFARLESNNASVNARMVLIK
ncbi:T9SS type A sorting domain-containing protein [bacterium]|nr:T9SS type A sorting domain-containing protein [bacterium]